MKNKKINPNVLITAHFLPLKTDISLRSACVLLCVWHECVFVLSGNYLKRIK